jgi:UDP:flavonoid glycosyltransferase YjiC (YdhE family)
VRILFVSWPGYGHLLPMVPLIRAAQGEGHEVVVSSGTDLAGVVEGLGVEFRPSGMTAAEGYAGLPDSATVSRLPVEEQVAFAGRYLFGAGAVARARDLLALIWTWRPDLVVHDTLELGSPVAAETVGISHLTHGYGPMLAQNDAMISWIGEAIGSSGLADPVPAVLAAPYLDICPPALHPDGTSRWTDVRPLRASAGEPGTVDLAPELAALRYADSVYVTLGTVMNQAPQVFAAVVDACAELQLNAIVTTGPEVDSEGLGLTGPAVLARPFLPQASVLPHCRVVVSHAGAGTMLGALCHGLPQLCLPQSTDQPLNAAALLPTGAALVLDPDEVDGEAVASALGRLLHEPAFSAAADALREQIEQMPDAATVLADVVGETRAVTGARTPEQ